MRIALGVEYDGQSFCGWQAQAGDLPTVQDALEKGLSQVAATPVRIVCAGRTDTGVHALGQVVHFDTQAQRSMHSWVFGTNANVPKSVSVRWAMPVSAAFHARFSALRRHYRYVILNRDVRPSFAAGRVTWEYRPLDVGRMQLAAQHLVGRHDFSSYRAVACQAHSPVREVSRLELCREADIITLDIVANAFLHHMVRNIAGVLISIGAGEQDSDWSREVLEHRDRTRGGITAPAAGLYFMGVEYPAEFALPRLSPTRLVW